MAESHTVQPQFAYKWFEEELGPSRNPPHFYPWPYYPKRCLFLSVKTISLNSLHQTSAWSCIWLTMGKGNNSPLRSKISINRLISIMKCVPCTYPLTCFCVAVDHPDLTGRKNWLAIPYNYTSILQGYPSCLPGCRWIPWKSFPHQEPASMDFYIG